MHSQGESSTLLEFERLIPDSRKVVLQQTGHISMAERPAAFNDLMMDFLAESGPASLAGHGALSG